MARWRSVGLVGHVGRHRRYSADCHGIAARAFAVVPLDSTPQVGRTSIDVLLSFDDLAAARMHLFSGRSLRRNAFSGMAPSGPSPLVRAIPSAGSQLDRGVADIVARFWLLPLSQPGVPDFRYDLWTLLWDLVLLLREPIDPHHRACRL